EQPLGPHELPLLAGEPPLGAGGEPLGLGGITGDEGGGERRALPELVVVDLGDRRAEPVLQLRLGGEDVLALPLQRPGLREVELDGEDRDEAGAQDGSAGVAAVAPAGAGSSSEVRSTSRVSYTSNTSPSRRSLKPSRRMPHSKPSATSRTSSLKRRSWATVVVWIPVPSRKMRTFEPRRTRPLVTMQPAIVP